VSSTEGYKQRSDVLRFGDLLIGSARKEMLTTIVKPRDERKTNGQDDYSLDFENTPWNGSIHGNGSTTSQ